MKGKPSALPFNRILPHFTFFCATIHSSRRLIALPLKQVTSCYASCMPLCNFISLFDSASSVSQAYILLKSDARWHNDCDVQSRWKISDWGWEYTLAQCPLFARSLREACEELAYSRFVGEKTISNFLECIWACYVDFGDLKFLLKFLKNVVTQTNSFD